MAAQEPVANVTAATSQYGRRMIGQADQGWPRPPRRPRGCGSATRPRCQHQGRQPLTRGHGCPGDRPERRDAQAGPTRQGSTGHDGLARMLLRDRSSSEKASISLMGSSAASGTLSGGLQAALESASHRPATPPRPMSTRVGWEICLANDESRTVVPVNIQLLRWATVSALALAVNAAVPPVKTKPVQGPWSISRPVVLST